MLSVEPRVANPALDEDALVDATGGAAPPSARSPIVTNFALFTAGPTLTVGALLSPPASRAACRSRLSRSISVRDGPSPRTLVVELLLPLPLAAGLFAERLFCESASAACSSRSKRSSSSSARVRPFLGGEGSSSEESPRVIVSIGRLLVDMAR